jgi:hypothetical protein
MTILQHETGSWILKWEEWASFCVHFITLCTLISRSLEEDRSVCIRSLALDFLDIWVIRIMPCEFVEELITGHGICCQEEAAHSSSIPNDQHHSELIIYGQVRSRPPLY